MLILVADFIAEILHIIINKQNYFYGLFFDIILSLL